MKTKSISLEVMMEIINSANKITNQDSHFGMQCTTLEHPDLGVVVLIQGTGDGCLLITQN